MFGRQNHTKLHTPEPLGFNDLPVVGSSAQARFRRLRIQRYLVKLLIAGVIGAICAAALFS